MSEIPFLEIGRHGFKYAVCGDIVGRMVLTNGCFDILHRGHVECLQYARAQGDFLVVALNDDEGIRQLKDENRPVNALEDRMLMLTALRCVDMVISFHGTRATELFKVIHPDVYVKGGDYTLDTLDPDERAAISSWNPPPEIRFFPFKTHISTTEIIRRAAL